MIQNWWDWSFEEESLFELSVHKKTAIIQHMFYTEVISLVV